MYNDRGCILFGLHIELLRVYASTNHRSHKSVQTHWKKFMRVQAEICANSEIP